jgi:hypothetical protein
LDFSSFASTKQNVDDTICLDVVSRGFKDDIANENELLVSRQDWDSVSNTDPARLEAWASHKDENPLDLIENNQVSSNDIQSKINLARKLVLKESSNSSTIDSSNRRDILEKTIESLSIDDSLPSWNIFRGKCEDVARLLDNQVFFNLNLTSDLVTHRI